jgi:hypothetical protein
MCLKIRVPGIVHCKPKECDDQRQHDAKRNPLNQAGAAHTAPQAMPLLAVGLVTRIIHS